MGRMGRAYLTPTGRTAIGQEQCDNCQGGNGSNYVQVFFSHSFEHRKSDDSCAKGVDTS